MPRKRTKGSAPAEGSLTVQTVLPAPLLKKVRHYIEHVIKVENPELGDKIKPSFAVRKILHDWGYDYGLSMQKDLK